ncbi:hypothetical protein EE612_044358 [Oryza sativa]|uniref:Endoglucanase n=1 Tax=Oryza sativa subsp. indica TaxID=39946 RepID=A2YVD7_ORYSI|nr:hypothetical protein OsI_29295 [Oryza sativa Indica Group]KAB8108561.1 hypothetical protein EE612_044358 [Oryza sativa]
MAAAMTMCAAVAVLLVLTSTMAAAAGDGDGDGGGFDYKKALHSGLLYFEAQRSGHLPYNQRVRWRGHSGLADGLQQGVDLVGGYYDAGDNVKFGLPMAFTMTMLSWAAAEFWDEIAAAGERRHVLEAIKWGTDYLVKAHTAADELWAEVGDGDTDHYCWQRPEDMTTSRQAYKVDRDNPGSDVAGETAAALAAASIVFRRSNPRYSRLLLRHAEQLFDFGDRYRGKYDSSIGEVRAYYASVSGYGDELLWAALWLHRATGRRGYLDYAVAMADELGGVGWAVTEFSWDVKYAGLQILAAKVLMDGGDHPAAHAATLEQYRSKAEHYLCACLGKNAAAGDNVNRTAGGMLFVRRWNNMQYVTNAAFLLTVYSRYLRDSGGDTIRCSGGAMATGDELAAMARAQADYVLGDNPAGVSYMVGYGRRFPRRVHHRGASMVSHRADGRFVGCVQGYDRWFRRGGANPNVVAGAIVGGPDDRDRFRDSRDNYMQTEACTYNTAPMVGVFAHLHAQKMAARTANNNADRSMIKRVD